MDRQTLQQMSVQQLQRYRTSLSKNIQNMRLFMQTCRKQQANLNAANLYLQTYSEQLKRLEQASQQQQTVFQSVFSKGAKALHKLHEALPQSMTAAVSSLPKLSSINYTKTGKSLLTGLWSGVKTSVNVGVSIGQFAYSSIGGLTKYIPGISSNSSNNSGNQDGEINREQAFIQAEHQLTGVEGRQQSSKQKKEMLSYVAAMTAATSAASTTTSKKTELRSRVEEQKQSFVDIADI